MVLCFAPRSFSDPDITSDAIELSLKNLTLQQKVGQLFIFGFRGESIKTGLFDDKKLPVPGGVVLFGANIKSISQLRALTHRAQVSSLALTKLPMFIAIDQEGGKVIRIKTSPPLPSALALGQAGEPELCVRSGQITGDILRAFGVNMNFAPVMDLSEPNEISFIGTRSFGKEPNLVGPLATAFIKGVASQKVLSVLKHFPGHGEVTVDSHQNLPIKYSDVDELLKNDLAPYTYVFKENLPAAVMMAHVAFPKIDPSGVPATFSASIIQQLLRKKLAFDGLVITDDIEMLGGAKVGSVEERAVLALESGVDLVMVAWNRPSQIRAYQAVLAAVQSGRLSEERINQSVRRILREKQKMFMPESAISSPIQTLAKKLKSSKLLELTRDLTEQNILASNLLPKLKEYGFSRQTKLFILSRSSPFSFEVKKQWRHGIIVSPEANPKKLENLLNQQKSSQALVLFHITNEKSASLAEQLSDELASKTIIVNGDLPGLVRNQSRYLAVVNLFTKAALQGTSVVQALLKAPALPRLPTEDTNASADE